MSDEMTKLQRLQTVLEQYGARPTNWPVGDRPLVEFMQQDEGAERLFREAEALDHLLDYSTDTASSDSEQIASLQQNILADFDDLHKSDRQGVIPFGQFKKPATGRLFDQTGLATTMALAACFAFGIYLGGFGVGDWTLDLATDIQSLSGGTDRLADITDYVLSSGLEEDLL